jgi:mannosyltransferase
VRIWHVRRDPEMLLGIWARDVLRLPIRLVFTSAAQRRHGAFPRWLISKMDGVIATTERAAAHVPNTTAVQPHGIDPSRFAPVDKRGAWAASGLPGTWGIGVFGRVRPEKGTDVFVDALIQVLPEFPAFTAIITGLVQPQFVAYAKELQARIDAAGLSQRLRFLGDVPAAEVHLWPQRCLIGVASAREEQFGLTPFESAATGCALVCTRTGAWEMLVRPGVDGELVPTGDAPALAAALAPLMADPERTRQMGLAAQARVNQLFSIQAEAAGIGRVYQTVFERAARSQAGAA